MLLAALEIFILDFRVLLQVRTPKELILRFFGLEKAMLIREALLDLLAND